MTAVSDFHREYALVISERQLQDMVIGLAKTLGWLVYHPWSSKHSEAGWPDLAMVRPGRFILAELKRMPTSRNPAALSPAQCVWRDALIAAGVEVHVWRPSDWLSGEVEAVLRGQESVEVSLRREGTKG